MAEAATARTQTGILGWIERTGNKLPDPVFLFFYLILSLVVISIVASLAGWSAVHPTEVDPETGAAKVIAATSLLSTTVGSACADRSRARRRGWRSASASTADSIVEFLPWTIHAVCC